MQFNVSVKIPNPSTYSRDTRHGDVFGAVVACHHLAAALVCGIRRTGTTQILFRCLHDTFGVLNSLVHAVPVLAHLCVCFFFSGCTASFSGFRRHLGEGVIKLTNIKFHGPNIKRLFVKLAW